MSPSARPRCTCTRAWSTTGPARAATCGDRGDPAAPARPARGRRRAVAVARHSRRWRRVPPRARHRQTSRRVRSAARARFGAGRRLAARLVEPSSRPVLRFGEPHGVIVASVRADNVSRAYVFMSEAAAALTPVLEREELLARGSPRERVLTKSGETRLTRLGFDLHDGPVQDVLALAADIRLLRDQVYPFVLESHLELASGGSTTASHGWSSSTVGCVRSLMRSSHAVSSPGRCRRCSIARSTGTRQRTGIDARLDIKGDAESLSPRSGSRSSGRYRSRWQTSANTPGRRRCRCGCGGGAPWSR